MRSKYIIFISIISLYLILFYNINTCEKFIDNSIIQLEEIIDDISSDLIVYLTVFNKKSIDDNDKNIWYNLSTKDLSKTCITGPSNFKFDSKPVFSKINGVYLGNNRIIGPYCNELSVKFSDKFTIMFSCKHGNLLSNTSNEIELIKMYANSPNNNAFSLFIKADSIDNKNNVQTGQLLFKYIDQDPISCIIDSNHEYINLDKDILSIYFIIKDSDNIRILYLNETSNVIYQLCKINIQNNNITFSNKEFVINRFVNWNASLYNFSLYNTAITDDLVGTIYTHTMIEYIKNKDPLVNTLVPKYNNMIDYLNSLKKCPFDKNTCSSCDDILDWSSVNAYNLKSTNKTCKETINKFCIANPNNLFCNCWDSTNNMYKDPICVSIRENYSGNISNKLDNLNPDDIDYIKSKYNIIQQECFTNKPVINDNNNKISTNTLDFRFIPVVMDDNNYGDMPVSFDVNDYLNGKVNIKNDSVKPTSTFFDKFQSNLI